MSKNFNQLLFEQERLNKVIGIIISFQRETQLFVQIAPFEEYNSSEVLCIATNSQSTIIVRDVFNVLKTSCRFLTNINLTSIKLKDQGLKLIKKAEFKFINKAAFTNNLITHEGVKHIVQCKWDYLTILLLGANAINNKGLYYLSQSNWPFLTNMNLGKVSITDDGIKYLAKAQWKKLALIVLQQNKLTNSFIKCFLTANFPQLRCIYYEQSQVSFLDNTIAKFPQEWNNTFLNSNFLHASQRFMKMINIKMEKQFADIFQSQSDSENQ